MTTGLRAMRDETRDALSLLVLAVFCQYDKLLLGPYAVVDFYDALEVHFSHFKLMADLWMTHGAFSWYPFHAGGVPSFVGQHPPWHPAVFLASVLPIWLVGLLWNIGQTFLAGYGTYHFLRRLTNTSRPVALAMSALLAVSLVSGIVHSLMPYAFPALFVWTVDLWRTDTTRRRRLACALLILTVSLFSFPVLTLPHFPILHLALVLFMGRHLPDFKRQVVGVFAVWTGYVLIFVPSIVSLFLYIPYAQRDWGFTFPGFWPALKDLLLWFKGRLGDQGMIALIILGLALLRDRAVRTAYAFFVCVMLVAGVFSSEMKGLFTGSFLLKMDLFMFATTQGVLATIMVALIIEGYVRSSRGPDWRLVLASVAACSLLGSAHKVIGYVSLLGAGLAVIYILRSGKDAAPPTRTRWAAIALTACLCLLGMMVRQQYMLSGMFVPYAKGYLGHPELERLAASAENSPFRVACVDVHPAVIQARGLDTVGGKSPLFNKYYKEFVREVVRPQLETPDRLRQFDDLWRQLYLTRNQIDHDQRSVALKPARPRTAEDFRWPPLLAMNVTHVVSTAPLPGMETWAQKPIFSPGLAQEKPWLAKVGLDGLHHLPLWIYELKDANPRAYLAQPHVLPDDAAVLAAIGSGSAVDLRETAYLTETDARVAGLTTAQRHAGRPGLARMTSWSPDRLVLEGEVTEPCVLVVSNNFDPRWRASVNGAEPKPVLRANNAFQGVAIDAAGPFRVELSFSTPLIWWIHAPVIMGVLLVIIAVFLRSHTPCSSFAGIHVESCRTGQDIVPGRGSALLTGAAAAAIWALAFVAFVMRTVKGPQTETLPYALATIPFLGLGIALWCRGLLRRL